MVQYHTILYWTLLSKQDLSMDTIECVVQHIVSSLLRMKLVCFFHPIPQVGCVAQSVKARVCGAGGPENESRLSFANFSLFFLFNFWLFFAFSIV